MIHSLFALLLLLPGLSLAQQAFPYHISGKIGTLNAPHKVYLTYSDQVDRVDSATLTNGAFVLQGTAELPTRASLVVQANGYHPNAVLPTATSLFLEPTPVVVLSEGSLRAATTTITGGSSRLTISSSSPQCHPKPRPNSMRRLTPASSKPTPLLG
ncbi:MAG: DUF4369 domain-containing protein [Janthinobacterium lividum]